MDVAINQHVITMVKVLNIFPVHVHVLLYKRGFSLLLIKYPFSISF